MRPCARSMAIAALLLCAGAAALRAEDADPAAQVQLSTNRIHIGDLVTLRIDVRHGPGARVAWPALADGKRIVVREDRPGPERDAGRSSREWQLTSFEVGTHPLWTGRIAVVMGDGAAEELPGDAPVLAVESLLAGPDTPWRELKGLAAWPREGWLRLAALVVALALLALAAAGLRRWLRTRRAAVSAAPPPELPHDAAMRALRELRARGWIEERNVMPFYVDLSGIVRRYIEGRYGLRAPEQTTEEFIRTASTSRLLSLEHQQLVEAFLAQSDLVKFARHTPGREDMEAAYASAERLVRETTPPPASSGTAAAS